MRVHSLALRQAPADLLASALPMTSAVVSRLSVYFVLIIAARLLSADQFGLFATVMVMSGIVSALVSGGGDMWLNRFTSRTTTIRLRAPYLWRPYLAICGTVAAIVVALGLLIISAAPLSAQVGLVAVIMLVGAIAAGLAEAEFAVLRASGLVTAFFAARDLALPLVYLVLMITLRPSTAAGVLTIHASLWLTALILVGAVVWHRTPTRHRTTRLRRRGRRRLLQHTLGLQAGNLSNRLAVQIDVLVLTWIITLGAVGEYRVAAQFAIGFAVVQHFVFLGLPWQMRQASRGQAATARPHSGHTDVVRRQRVLIALSAVALAAVWLFAEPFLALIAPRFADSAWLLRLLLLVRFTELLWGPQHEILVSNGLPQRDAGANLVAIAAWIAGFLAFWAFASPIAAAVAAAAIGSAAGQIMRYRAVRAAGLAPVFGHPWGAWLPLTLSAAALIGALALP